MPHAIPPSGHGSLGQALIPTDDNQGSEKVSEPVKATQAGSEPSPSSTLHPRGPILQALSGV